MKRFLVILFVVIVILKVINVFRVGELTFTIEELVFYTSVFFGWMLFGQKKN